jgi:hypothetical protein
MTADAGGSSDSPALTVAPTLRARDSELELHLVEPMQQTLGPFPERRFGDGRTERLDQTRRHRLVITTGDPYREIPLGEGVALRHPEQGRLAQPSGCVEGQQWPAGPAEHAQPHDPVADQVTLATPAGQVLRKGTRSVWTRLHNRLPV